jgi:decaprenylphospho-beta-D-ribofuranose 2-oxidase
MSFDGSSEATARCLQPDRYSFWDRGIAGISRGAGLSYTAASFSEGGTTVDHRRFNRILDFDSREGIVEVEAGITLGQIYEFATPRSLYLPVQPGHPSITVGGCIGADVHGKNQYRDGTAISQVESVRLFHPRHGILELSREKSPEIFRLTCGGYGLTGNILSARLKLTPLPGTRGRLAAVPIESCDGLSDRLAASAASADLIYSWHDFSAPGNKTFGSGLIISGSFERTPEAEPDSRAQTGFRSSLDSATRGAIPLSLFNRATTRLVNATYKWMTQRSASRLVPLSELLFPVYGKEFYFHLFGRRGFHEYQCIVPSSAFPGIVSEVRKRLIRRPLAITLASGKFFGGERDLLRFTGTGVCFALNFPRSQAGLEFAAFLDELMQEFRGYPNIIKDSRLTAAVVARTYPEYEIFRERLRAFDPSRLYQSELSQRLGL